MYGLSLCVGLVLHCQTTFFFFCVRVGKNLYPNTKEKKVVWLCGTSLNLSYITICMHAVEAIIAELSKCGVYMAKAAP